MRKSIKKMMSRIMSAAMVLSFVSLKTQAISPAMSSPGAVVAGGVTMDCSLCVRTGSAVSDPISVNFVCMTPRDAIRLARISQQLCRWSKDKDVVHQEALKAAVDLYFLKFTGKKCDNPSRYMRIDNIVYCETVARVVFEFEKKSPDQLSDEIKHELAIFEKGEKAPTM